MRRSILLSLLAVVICLSLFLFPGGGALAQGPTFQAELNKSFTPISIIAGETSRLRVTIYNPNNFVLNNAAWSDNLVGVQPGIRIGSPVNLTNTCGGTVTAAPGGTTLALSGGTVPAQVGINPGSCYVEIDVTSTTAGNLVNTIPIGALTATGTGGNVSNTTPASATLRVRLVQPPSLSKGFSPNTIFIGQTSALSITIRNVDLNTTLTGVSIEDNLPAGLVLASPVSPSLSGCGSAVTLTANAGEDTVQLSGAQIAPNGSCIVRVNVTSTSQNVYTNTIPTGAIQNQQGVTNAGPATANLNVQVVGLTKAFSPTSFQAGGTSTLTITLRNPTASNYTNASLTDTLPTTPNTNLEYVSGSATNTCGGSVTVTPPRTIQLTGGTIPPGTCTITVQVTTGAGAPAATYANVIPPNSLSAFQGSTPITNLLEARANVSVYAAGTGITGAQKVFNNNPIYPNENTRLRITIPAPADTNLTNFSLTDNLPSGVTISNSTAPATTGCGAATLTATTGTSVINLTGGTINAGTSCLIDVWVTSATSGLYRNTIAPTDISNDQNRRPSGNITRDLHVLPLSSFSISKIFTPAAVTPNGISTLTITLQNTSLSPLVDVTVSDPLPFTDASNGIFAAPTPNASTTCGDGVVTVNTAGNGSQTVVLTGGEIPAQVDTVPGICTITIDVQGRGAATTRTNTIPIANAVATDLETGVTMVPINAATAQLTIANLSVGIVKGFNPLTVFGGSASTLTIELANTNNAALSGIAFSDTMPDGMIIASPPNLSTGTCGGTLTGTPGSNTFSFTGGALPANTSCFLSLSVTMTVNANLTNTIPASAVSTDNGATNPDPTRATLTNLPGASISKVFLPNSIPAGGTSTLTITIQNTGNVPITGMGLIDDLPGTLPAGVVVASTPAASTTCGGTLLATPATQRIQLTGGTMPGSSSCTITVPVTGTVPGSYQNVIPESSLTNNESVTNTQPAIDTLTITGAPALNVTKTARNPGPYTLGQTVTYDIVVQNTGSLPLTGVSVTDPGVGVTLGTCTPAQPAALAVSESMTCTATHVITQTDVDAGSYSNTAFADSDQTGPDSDPETVPVTQNGAITLQKTGALNLDVVAPAGVPNPGDQITYTFSVTNSGDVTLTNVTLADTIGGITILGGPIPSLASGATDSTTFTGRYTLTQADIDAGRFTNTATVTGTTPTLSTVTDTDDDTQFLTATPLIGVAKRVTGTPVLVTRGTWDVTYTILVRNYGNIPLARLQVTDSLVTTFPPNTTFTVQSVTSSDFTVNWPGYNGSSATNLLAGTDTLAVGEEGEIQLVVRVTPDRNGPFDNTAIATGYDGDTPVTDRSQDGVNPDPDGDGDPTDNNVPTPVVLGPELFAPPMGIKVVDGSRAPILRWSVTWINHTNRIAVHSSSTDGIPEGTVFSDNGVPSGYPLPTGTLPAGTVATGVACEDTSTITTTQYCYYEGPTSAYPRGRIVWQGILGPDFGITTPDAAANEIRISFSVRADAIIREVRNTATLDSDLNGDGDATDTGELRVATVSAVWTPSTAGGEEEEEDEDLPGTLPATGFAPGRVTSVGEMPSGLVYNSSQLMLDIPDIAVSAPITGVPLEDGDWQLDWLGQQVGHLEGTAFPTWEGNSVLTAHVYDANGKPGPFVNLSQLRYGQKIVIHAWGADYVYEVRSVRTRVRPDAANVITHEERAWLTLITCQGYDERSDSYRWRVVVRAVLVEIN